jgi:hypothetical protein
VQDVVHPQRVPVLPMVLSYTTCSGCMNFGETLKKGMSCYFTGHGI